MNPWIRIFSAYIAEQLPDVGNEKKVSLLLVQAFCDRYRLSSIDIACRILSQCSFVNTKTLDMTSNNDISLNESSINEGVLLVCRLKEEKEGNTGACCLEDIHGNIISAFIQLDHSILNQIVLLKRWKYIKPTDTSCLSRIKCMNQKVFNYIEIEELVHANYCTLQKDGFSVNGNVGANTMNVSKYLELHCKSKLTNLKGRVISLSNVHKLRGCSPFYFIRIQCILNPVKNVVVVIQGGTHVHWHGFITLFTVITVTDIKLAVMNKGSIDERKVLCNSKTSTFYIDSPCDSSCDSSSLAVDTKIFVCDTTTLNYTVSGFSSLFLVKV